MMRMWLNLPIKAKCFWNLCFGDGLVVCISYMMILVSQCMWFFFCQLNLCDLVVSFIIIIVSWHVFIGFLYRIVYNDLEQVLCNCHGYNIFYLFDHLIHFFLIIIFMLSTFSLFSDLSVCDNILFGLGKKTLFRINK